MLGVRAIVGGVVEIGVTAEVDYGEFCVADLDAAVQVVDHESIVATTTSDNYHLEQVVQVLHGRVAGPAVTGIGKFVSRILAHLEGSTASAVEQVADDQLVVEYANIRAEGLGTSAQILHQSIDGSRFLHVEKLVLAQVAGDGVAAQAAVDDVVET